MARPLPIVELAGEVVRVDLDRQHRHDVVDVRLAHGFDQALGERGLVGGHEQLEETLELGLVNLVQEAEPTQRAALELRHQGMVDAEHRGLRFDADTIEVEVVRHHHQRDLVLLILFHHLGDDLEQILELPLERLIGHVVGARGAQQRVEPHQELGPQGDAGGGVAAAFAGHATIPVIASSHAFRTGPRFDRAPRSSTSRAAGLPIRASTRATD